ncbi:RtcB family protein [Rhizobium sp. FKL33]|uniref:RtcB family protein n=1 Tax=Rhizobium sp. FKL33 TaxID=2562307 RepID=UPI0010BF9A99|nr:RtcB family protein [Rhizobium sp. FKL33]
MPVPSSIRRAGVIAGHVVRSVVAHDEPDQNLVRAFADLAEALPTPEALAAKGASISAVATTPDFHPGKPVPVGVVADVDGAVLPHMIGSDIGCGMRMIVLDDVTVEDLAASDLDGQLRHLFFQGGRDIALTGRNRSAILREGLPGLLESLGDTRLGLLAKLDMTGAWADLDRQSDMGVFASAGVDPDFEDYARLDDSHRRDAILGTIGGGNHFVEFGAVEHIADGAFARAAGLKPGAVVVVVHSGSLDFGQRVGTAMKEKLRADARAGADWRVLSQDMQPDLFERYMMGHANAVNAAFANRFLIGLIAVEALARTLNRTVAHRLVYDAPHNTVWRHGDRIRHRKGACPARGASAMAGGPYQWFGEPVILPGSMGDGSWLLCGQGADETLHSSAHGAGRKLSRQGARAETDLSPALRVIGPVDPRSPMLQGRRDILADLQSRLHEEAPGAYKPIESVVDPMEAAGVVTRVAKVRPVLTVKG